MPKINLERLRLISGRLAYDIGELTCLFANTAVLGDKYSEIEDSEMARSFYALSHACIRGIGAVVFGYRVEGAEYLPAKGRGVVALNHTHWSDVLWGPDAIPRHAVVAGRRKYMEHPLTGPLFRSWGAVTIDRPQEDASYEAMKATLETMTSPLESDNLLVLFGSPNTRTPGVKPGKPVRGIAVAAQKTKSPVIPGVIKGADRLSRKIWTNRVVTKFAPDIGYPDNRREHDEFLDHLHNVQLELHDSIEHLFEYADPDDC